MQLSRRWFLAAGCWLMACLVAPGALRVAAAVAAAATPVNTFLPEASLGAGGLAISSNCSSGGSSSSSSSMPRAATNAAASAAAAAAALAAVATGTLSLSPNESWQSAAATTNVAPGGRENLLKALGVAAAPASSTAAAAAAAAGSYVGATRSRLAAAEGLWRRRAAVRRLQQQQQKQQQQVHQGVRFHSMQQQQQQQQQSARASLFARRLPASLFGCMYTRGLFAAAAAAAAKQKPALPLGPLWTKRLQQQQMQMKRIDAGGGGDCLFLSVALALREEGSNVDAQRLRDIAALKVAGLAEKFEKGDEEEFMERLRLLSVLEETGDWGDHWSPSAVLNSSDIYISNAGAYFDVRTPQGKAKAVYHELKQPGNNHWGTAADICALEEALDVGIIVLNDSNGAIYPTGCNVKPRSKYIFLYFVNGSHFQLAGVEGRGGLKCLFRPEEIPAPLLQFFKTDTRNHLIFPSAKRS
ncbi:hypothetical protein, conserved [Eimeria acervulina]|uniref:OTU-like cysteine protease domain-containing protein n=1 Tax=Eimeria acervulina TaxID=5801 RepID=U6GAV4_EIMAC|nr:hypothetical protein, conserved [Eimeria acervulina]CDI77265.1 hypothetical protein, conserved [Eimeria acervulina]